MRNVTEIKEVAVWAKIIAAIYHYQNNHRGLSPTDEMIAIEAGVSRDVVRSQMREMEKAGLLTDSKRWPRHITIKRDVAIDKIMDVIDPKQQPLANGTAPQKKVSRITDSLAWRLASPEERAQWRSKGGKSQWAKKTPEEKAEAIRKLQAGRWPKKAKSQVETKEETVTEKKTDRVEVFKRKPFFERAKQIAILIDEHSDRYGVPPSGVWLRQKLAEAQGITNRLAPTNLLSVAVTQMVEEGWLDHKANCHADYRLTNLGRTALLHAGTVEPEVMKHQPEPVVPPKPLNRPEMAPVAHPAIEKPPVVTIRGYRPDTPPERVEAYVGIPDLSNVDSLDLAMELQKRGWRVMR